MRDGDTDLAGTSRSSGPTAPAGSATTDELDPRRWRALFVMLMGQFCALLDVSVTNVALPSIGRSTGAGPTELQWVVSGYILAFGLMPVIGGRLGDATGRRRMFVVGVSGFVVASAAAGLAPSPGALIAVRVVQGLFGGVIGPQVSGFIQNTFPRAERGRAFGRLGLTVGVGTALGPVVGGLLIAAGGPEYGWRLVFFINVPIGLVAVLLARAWVPVVRPRAASSSRLDLLGALLLGTGLLCVLFPIVEINQLHDVRLFLLLVPAAGLLLMFVRREAHLTRADAGPLLDLRLFRVPTFVTGVVFAVVFFCSNTGIPLVLSLYYQDGLGFTALHSGLGVTALALGSVLGAPLAGRLVQRVGRPLVVGAVLVFFLATTVIGVVLLLDPVVTPLQVGLRLALPLFALGIAGGSIVTPNQTLTLAEVDPVRGGAAGGVLQTAQRVGSATGQTVLGTVFVAALGAGAAAGTAGRPGPYTGAVTSALAVSLVFSGAALVLSVVELRRARRRAAVRAHEDGRQVPDPSAP
ncbi:MFS transporter [Microlunatus flavus]|uniref:Drug resistance transporter, EmrB/QacA subfamily n=1 Tax=Microlunatus flavus TaxID=1036181 RepID=A0A1H9HDI8_9ACTN|nr:MFS transporter [Microlunatus flavus]SEQ60318.1 drug resistance transporter, EmrB/QacA subfamily [Microlunatus flavus]